MDVLSRVGDGARMRTRQHRMEGYSTPFISSLLLQLLLLMTICCVDLTAAVEHAVSLEVLDGIPDIGYRTSSAGMAGPPRFSDSPSSVADRRRASDPARRLQSASLARRDASSSRNLAGLLGPRQRRRPLIVYRRPAATGDGSTTAAGRQLARLSVVNYSTRSVGAGLGWPDSAEDQPRTAAVNPSAALITRRRQPHHRRRRRSSLQLSTANTRCRRRSIISRAFTDLFAPRDIDVSPPVVASADKHRSHVPQQDTISSQNVLNSTHHRGPDNHLNKANEQTAFANIVGTLSDIHKNSAGLESAEVRALRRRRREIGNESLSDGTSLSSSTQTISNATMAEQDAQEVEQMEIMPSGAAALRYRSRGNFAALVDPLQSGRARSGSSNLWLLPATTNFSSTSSPTAGLASDPVSTPGDHQNFKNHENFVAVDSIDVKVLRIAANNSTDEANSTNLAITNRLSIDLLESNNSGVETTMAVRGEWNCNVELIQSLGAGLRKRMSPSTTAICAYSLSFFFTLIATFAVTSLILHTCVSSFGKRSALVLGFVALAAATRALYFVTAEYQLATVAPPGCRTAICECFFALLLAAYVAHHYRLNVKADADDTTLAGSHRVKRSSRIRLCRDLFQFLAGLCFCLAPVVSVVLLIQSCILPVEAVFVMRSMLALLAVSLSAANVYKISTSFGCPLATRVILCLSFVAYSGFSVFDAATLSSNDLADHLRQNANLWIAVEATQRSLELIIPVMFCLPHSPMFSSILCLGRRKNFNSDHSETPQTKRSGQKSVVTLEGDSPAVRHYFSTMILSCKSPKNTSKVVDSTPLPSVSLAVGWRSEEDSVDVDHVPASQEGSWKPRRSRSMLYNDRGFIRFRLDGDTDGESDARTLDDDDGAPEQARSAPASEYASADDLFSRRGGPSSTGTPRWSGSGTPSFSGFRAPSIHLQDSIDRALDCCDIWRVGRDQGQLNGDELRRIVQVYADVRDGGRGREGARRRADRIWATHCTEV